MNRFSSLLMVLLITHLVSGNDASLSLERIYRDGEFSAKSYSATWMDATSYLRVEDSKLVKGGQDLVRYDAESGERVIFVPASHLVPHDEAAPLDIADFSVTPSGSHVLIYTNTERVWRRHSRGDYWVLDRSAAQLRKLAPHAVPQTTQFAKFSPDATKVAYVAGGNIFVEDLVAGSKPLPLTQKRTEQEINGTFDWVYEEEFGLRDGFRWSPDSQRIAYWQLNTTGVPTFTMINNTDSFYPRLIQFAHPKTGQRNAACRVGVVPVTGGRTTWMNIPGEQRENYIARMHWVDHPQQLVIQQLNRLQNTKRLFFATESGDVRLRLTDTDEAWVDANHELFWSSDGQSFSWISERDGWRHAYWVHRNGGELVRMTPEPYDVVELLNIDSEEHVYFVASPHDAASRYLFASRRDGSESRRLTPQQFSGSNQYKIAPGGAFAMHTHSAVGKPPTTALIRLPSHERLRILEANEPLREKLAKLADTPTEFFRIPIGEGIACDAWCMHPAKIERGKRYPLLVYVYGEPAGSTVQNRWGGTGYLWHRYLTEQGYVVVSIDNRGTKVPRGRAWRKSIYRQVGVIAPQDQAAAVRWLLKDRPYLDPERVGVWGWSGGGSMSLNAIFKYPKLYKTAISIAPVPNQRYYDTIYQERYMGLPRDNAQGYHDGSPIHYAHQLEGNLLLVHGTGDDNCHYQTMELLINELVRHDKAFTMMAYPNRSHSIREGKNTTLHLRRLMTRFLRDNL